MNPQQFRVPLAYVEIGGKRVPCYIDPAWYQYLAIELFNRAGGDTAPTNLELAKMARPVFFDEGDGTEEVFFIPQQQTTQPQPQQTIIIWDETLQDEPMMRG